MNNFTHRHHNLFRYINIFLFLTLLITCQCHANYSKPYDKEINDLSILSPEKSLTVSKNKLAQAQLDGNVENQLVSLYYIVQALDFLSLTQEMDSYINIGLELAKTKRNLRFQSEFLSLQSHQYILKGRYYEAIVSVNKALQFAQEVDDERLKAQHLAVRGQVQLATENYDLALKDVETALEVFKAHNDRENLSLYYNLLAIIYYSMNDLDNSIKYYQESNNYDDLKSPYNLAITYYNIGSAYVGKKDYDKGIEYYKKSMLLSKQINDKTVLAFTNYGMAEVYILQRKNHQAEEILIPAMKIFKSIEDELMLFNANLLMAELKTKNKEYPSALNYLDLAEAQNKGLNTDSANLYYLNHKIEYFVAQDMWKQAYELTKLVSEAKEKLLEDDKEKLTSELKIRFNYQFDQEKLELLTRQNKFQKQAITQEQTRQKYLWGLIALSFLVFLVTFYGYKNQKKIKRHLYHQSITDYLTNVSNRRHIVQQLMELHQLSLSENTSFGLVMIDLDYFKKINDSYGHDVGNEVLIYFAKTAKSIIGQSGKIGRIGGEEWLLLFPNAPIDVIKNQLIDLRSAFKDSLSLKIPSECILSFSSGVIMCSGQYENHEKMLSDVDNAMYSAKQKGREQDVFLMVS